MALFWISFLIKHVRTWYKTRNLLWQTHSINRYFSYFIKCPRLKKTHTQKQTKKTLYNIQWKKIEPIWFLSVRQFYDFWEINDFVNLIFLYQHCLLIIIGDNCNSRVFHWFHPFFFSLGKMTEDICIHHELISRKKKKKMFQTFRNSRRFN